jgi:hypothetical protein
MLRLPSAPSLTALLLEQDSRYRSAQAMLKHNKKRILIYLLALGIFLAQCTIVFAESQHPLHKATDNCDVCLVAGHLSHAMVASGLTLNIEHFSPQQGNDAIASLVIASSVPYLIRGPPLY